MDLTSQVLHEVEFRESKRGYHTQDVDEFLERLAVAVDRQEAQLREARQRVAAAEGRIAEAERRAEDAERRAGGGSDADETLKRTLVLAQRTADAAIREAEEHAARLVAAAEDESQRLVREAHETSAQAYADAEAEARRASHEARSRVLAELQELEAGREMLRNDVELLEHHIEGQRERLRLSIRDLTALVEDPAALRAVAPPVMAEVTIPEPQPAPAPARRLVAAPPPDDDPELQAEVHPDDIDWASPEIDVDDYEPVESPPARPRAVPDDRYERPLLADVRPVRPQPLAAADDDDEDEEDAYLAELRKAMTDDEPLGPRDEDDDGYEPGPPGQRSRFGRRR